MHVYFENAQCLIIKVKTARCIPEQLYNTSTDGGPLSIPASQSPSLPQLNVDVTDIH